MESKPRPQHHEDAELVRQFLSGRRPETFEALYDRHTPYLFRVALRLLGGNQAAAEDAVQEAWIRALVSLKHFRGESALRTWLCGITLNCCRETWRRKETLPLDGVVDFPDPGSGEGGRLQAVRLERALAHLDEDSRLMIELFDVLGHTHDEVAGILEIAVGTSKSRLFRARETLRSLLGTQVREEKRSYR